MAAERDDLGSLLADDDSAPLRTPLMRQERAQFSAQLGALRLAEEASRAPGAIPQQEVARVLGRALGANGQHAEALARA